MEYTAVPAKVEGLGVLCARNKIGPIAVFFPCSAFSLSTYKHLTRQTPSYHPQDET